MANVQDRGPPSAAAIAIGTAIVAGVTGFFIGQASSIGLFSSPSTRPTSGTRLRSRGDEAETSEDDLDAKSGDEEDDEDEDLQDLGELKTFPGNQEECKLVLVVRTDLGMGKGMLTCSYRCWSLAGVILMSAATLADALIAVSDVSPHLWSPETDTSSRQDCSTVLSRDSRMLQDTRACRSRTSCAEALGASGSGEGRPQS